MLAVPVLAGLLLLVPQSDTTSSRGADTAGTVPMVVPAMSGERDSTVLAQSGGVALRALPTAAEDTVRRRPKAFVYSDGYARRTTIHKWLSWTMLPLFAASYFSGNELINKSGDAPEWARQIHGPAATGTAVLFGANAITGSWNLWEGRKDPNGRTRRLLHSGLFMAASGGFAYTGTQLANQAEQSLQRRRDHRNMAVGSMGLATASWLLMLIGN